MTEHTATSPQISDDRRRESDMVRVKELAAMVLIGDGLLGLLSPSAHVRRWQRGPKWSRDIIGSFAHRPQLTRMVAGGELIAATVWALGLPAGDGPEGSTWRPTER